MADNQQLQERLDRVEELSRALELADPRTHEIARELVQTLLELHRVGLAELLEIVSRFGTEGQAIIQACTRDDLVGQLLILHGLHPADLETRVRQALDHVRPSFVAFGADVELVSLGENAVRLRLVGDCESGSSSERSLMGIVEDAICDTASDITTIEFVNEDGSDRAPSSRIIRLPVLNNPR